MAQPVQDGCLVADREAPTVRPDFFTPTIASRVPSRPRRPRSALFRTALASVVLVGIVWGAWVSVRFLAGRDNRPIENLPRVTVAKVDLSSILTTSGQVESSNNTIISCQLERLELGNRGRSITSGGASTILSLVEEGTQVKKGEILCLLDASEYEELVRTQEIKNEQAAAALRQAQLNFEVAELSVREYREGLYKQTLQSLEGMIILNQSDLERALDRYQWTEEMLEKGYAAVATRSNAERTLNQCRFDLESSRIELNYFRKFGNSKTMITLNSEVEKRRYEVVANTQRVKRNTERLAYYQKMVGNCTIRAPHDGFLIYAIDPNHRTALPIEPGVTVRQAQKLFLLPDLSRMEVRANLHESVADRVEVGMRARMRIEGLANRSLEGHVISVAPLPTTGGNWISDDVKFFVGIIKIDSAPKGLRPGMSAEVEVAVDRSLDVLAVPTEAIAVEQGRDICYIAGTDGLERRPVTLGRSSRDLLEVTEGLAEGDQVVLNPGKIEALDSLVLNPAVENPREERSTAEIEAPATSPISVQ